jgi:hypothetical protein
MTPSFSGRMAVMEPGVLPSISLATRPTALPFCRTRLVPFLTATTLGSLRTMPSPLTQTSVLQVPRSMPMSMLNIPSSESKDHHRDPLAPFLSTEQCIALIASALNDLAHEDARIWWRHEDRYRPHNVDWTLSARQTADRLRKSRPAEERTAIYRGVDEASVIFANEDFANGPSVRRQVALLRETLSAANIPELGFAISTDGGAWVMLVWTTKEEAFQSVITTLWKSGVAA